MLGPGRAVPGACGAARGGAADAAVQPECAADGTVWGDLGTAGGGGGGAGERRGTTDEQGGRKREG